MKNRITLLITLFTVTLLIAQKGYEPATIHFKNGTKEQVFIKYSEITNPDNIPYKKTLKSISQNIIPIQAIAIIFEETNRQITTENIDGVEKFLESIVQGKSNLLYLSEKKRYFLKSEKSGLKELKTIETITGTKKFILKEYVGILNLDFNDCNEISTKINNTRFQLKSLAKIFIAYNKCINEIGFISERLSRKPTHNVSLFTGLNSASTIGKGANPRGGNFDNSYNILVDAEYLYTPTLFNSKLGIVIGLNYRSVNNSSKYLRADVMGTNFATSRINLQTLNAKIGFQYKLGTKKTKITPMIGAYYIQSLILKKDGAYIRMNDNSEEELFLYSDVSSTKVSDLASGFGLEAGIDLVVLKNDSIKLRLGYELVDDFLTIVKNRYPVNSFIFKHFYNV